MKSVTINASVPYAFTAGGGLLDRCGDILAEATGARAAAVVTDGTVEGLYLGRVYRSLTAAGFSVKTISVPAGEASKTMRRAESLLGFFAEAGLDGGGLVAALGGGAVSDLAGFAAGIYMRGVRWACLPTTLLAAVDAPIDGRTAVDLPNGKNMAGVSWRPSAVICDTDTFKTLPPEALAEGAAEALKTAVIADGALFSSLEHGLEGVSLPELALRCAEIKEGVVSRDGRGSGARAVLTLGHTAAHAIEALSLWTAPHGRAVACGLGITARAAEKRGWCAPGCAARISAALHALGLPDNIDLPADVLAAAALSDEKRRGDLITLAVPARIGEVTLKTTPVSELRGFFAAGLEE